MHLTFLIVALCISASAIADHGTTTVTAPHVTCNSSSISITFNKTELDLEHQNYELNFLNTTSESCKITNSVSSGVNFTLNASFDLCGINLHQVDNETIKFNQTVVLFFFNNTITVTKQTSYIVQCVKENNKTVSDATSPIQVTINEDKIIKSSNANFDVKLTRKTNNGFYNQSEMSGVSTMGDDIFFKLVLETPRNDLVLSPQDCYATDGVNTNVKYYLIQNRCPNPQDASVKIDQAQVPSTEFVWHNQAFRFRGSSDELHFSCDVLICIDSNPAAACKRCGNSSRKRRSLSLMNTNDDVEMQSLTTKSTSVKIIFNL